MINDISLHFSLSLIFLFISLYVPIPVSSIIYFRNTVLGLPLSGFPSILSSIIVVIHGLFFIRCPIHVFHLSLSVFYIIFWVFILLKTSTFISFSVNEIFSVLLQHQATKASILVFSIFRHSSI